MQNGLISLAAAFTAAQSASAEDASRRLALAAWSQGSWADAADSHAADPNAGPEADRARIDRLVVLLHALRCAGVTAHTPRAHETDASSIIPPAARCSMYWVVLYGRALVRFLSSDGGLEMVVHVHHDGPPIGASPTELDWNNVMCVVCGEPVHCPSQGYHKYAFPRSASVKGSRSSYGGVYVAPGFPGTFAGVEAVAAGPVAAVPRHFTQSPLWTVLCADALDRQEVIGADFTYAVHPSLRSAAEAALSSPPGQRAWAVAVVLAKLMATTIGFRTPSGVLVHRRLTPFAEDCEETVGVVLRGVDAWSCEDRGFVRRHARAAIHFAGSLYVPAAARLVRAHFPQAVAGFYAFVNNGVYPADIPREWGGSEDAAMLIADKQCRFLPPGPTVAAGVRARCTDERRTQERALARMQDVEFVLQLTKP